MKTRRLVFLSALTAIALVISLLEQFIPVPIGVPGAKLGFSNIVILTTIVVFGPGDGMAVGVMKSFLLMLVTGSVTSFWFSLSGAFFSTLVMSLVCKKFIPPFSLIGASELGALAHNFGQFLVASFVLGNGKIFYYMPILTLVGIATGLFVGLSCNFVGPHLRKIYRQKESSRLTPME